jgi:hypothetical protein
MKKIIELIKTWSSSGINTLNILVYVNVTVSITISLLLLNGCGNNINESSVKELLIQSPMTHEPFKLTLGVTGLKEIQENFGNPSKRVKQEFITEPVEYANAQNLFYSPTLISFKLAAWKLSPIGQIKGITSGQEARLTLEEIHIENKKLEINGFHVGDSLIKIQSKLGKGQWYTEIIGNYCWLEYDKMGLRFGFPRKRDQPNYSLKLEDYPISEAIELFSVKSKKIGPFSKEDWRESENGASISYKGIHLGDDLSYVRKIMGSEGSWWHGGYMTYKLNYTNPLVTFFFRKESDGTIENIKLMSPEVVVGIDTIGY